MLYFRRKEGKSIMSKINQRMAIALTDIRNDFIKEDSMLFYLPDEIEKHKKRMSIIRNNVENIRPMLSEIVQISNDYDFENEIKISINDYNFMSDLNSDIYFYQQKLNESVNKLLDKKFEKFNKIVSRHINTNASDVAQKMAENLRNNTNENWTVIEYGPKDNYFSFQLRNNTKPNKSFFIQNSPVWYLGRTRLEGTGQLPDEKVLSVPYDEFGEKMYQLAWITCALDRAPASKSREYCARLRQPSKLYQKIPELESAVVAGMFDFNALVKEKIKLPEYNILEI